MKKTVLILMLLTVSSKALGFLREMLMSFYYGVGDNTDAFVMSSSAASIFLGWLGAVAVIHTPIFQEIRHKRGIKEAERFTNQTIFLELCVSVILIVVIHLCGGYILSWIATGFPPEKMAMTADFFSWSAVSVCFTSMSAILMSEQNCKGAFVSANATTILLSVSQIMCIFFANMRGDFTLLRFMLPVSGGLQFLILLLFSLRGGRRTGLAFPIMPEMRSLFVLLMPIFASSLMDEINAFVDKMFGSLLAEGSVSALNYVHLLKQLCFYVFASTMVTILYPSISQATAAKDEKRAADTVNAGVEYMALIFSWLSVYLFFYAEPIVSLVYRRGAFDQRAVQLTSECLMMYGTALLPLSIREILLKSAQSYKDTKINFFSGCLSTVANIILNILLIKPLRHMGLALSTSIAAYVTLPLMIVLLKRKNCAIFPRKVARELAVIFCAALFSVGSMKFSFFREQATTQGFFFLLWTLTLSAVLSLAVYLSLCYWFGIPSVRREAKRAMTQVHAYWEGIRK